MSMSFLIISALMLVAMIYILSGDLHILPVVRAGDVDKNIFGIKIIDAPERTTVESDGEVENITNMVAMYVKGNSMQDYCITNGQIIYVEPFTSDDQRENIGTYPVLVLEMQKNRLLSLFVSQLKLRKFICYIDNLDNVDWEEIYESHNEERNRIKLNQDDFVNIINGKIEEMKRKGKYLPNCKYTLSETYNESDECYSYSLHQVNKIYGKVRYAA